MPKRLVTPTWYRNHSHLIAYLLLALVSFLALAREEQLRNRESEHFDDVTAVLTMQAHQNCVAQNFGRREGNQRALALRRSLQLDENILSRFARMAATAEQASDLQALAGQFGDLAGTINDLPQIRCRV